MSSNAVLAYSGSSTPPSNAVLAFCGASNLPSNAVLAHSVSSTLPSDADLAFCGSSTPPSNAVLSYGGSSSPPNDTFGARDAERQVSSQALGHVSSAWRDAGHSSQQPEVHSVSGQPEHDLFREFFGTKRPGLLRVGSLMVLLNGRPASTPTLTLPPRT